MAHDLTYTFPIQKIDEDNSIQLIMIFNHSFATADFSYTATEKGLRVLQYGKLEMSYDLEDALLVPSRFSFILGDAEGELEEVFFGSSTTGTLTEKTAQCIVKINGSNKFIGNIIEDSIEFDVGTRILKFDAAPKTDAINKRMIYDEAGTALNPFGYASEYRNIISMVEDIFGLVNSSISYPTSFESIHDWEFQGINDSGGGYLNDIKFEELLQLTDPLFFDTSYSLSNCGEVLKKLAIDWGCFTGLISYEKAFFKKLFFYNENNLQEVSVYSWKKGFRYGLIDYIKLTTGISSVNEPYEEGTFTELEGRFLIRKTLAGFWVGSVSSDSNIKAIVTRSGYFTFVCSGGSITTPPIEGDQYSNNGSVFQIVGITPTNNLITAKRISGTNDPAASGDLIRVLGSGDATIAFTSNYSPSGNYTIYQTRDPNILFNAFSDHGDIMAKFWFKYRGNIQNCRVDKFIFKGIDYDFLKDFNHNGSKFQPIGMVFQYSQNITECEAIYLGELPVDDRLNVDNLIVNCGAINTTDFLQTSATGDPDGLSLNAAFSVVDEDGNRWLRMNRSGSANDYAGIQGIYDSPLLAGHTYNVRFKCRGNGAHISLYTNGGGHNDLGIVSDVEIKTATWTASGSDFVLSFNGESDNSKYWEIDYIEIYE